MASPLKRATQVSAVAADHISKSFKTAGGEVVALSDVSLIVASGDFVSLLGPSGCGKSTLLRIMAGLETPDAGLCTVDGEVTRKPSLMWGLVFQDHRLLPWLTVRQNVMLSLHMQRRDRAAKEERVRELLELVGVTAFADAKPHQLSGGMAQRVAIARALAPRPKLLFLDEPLGALDSMTRGRLQDELLRIWQHERLTVVMVTHDIEEAVYLSNRVVVMHPRPGRVRAEIPVSLDYPRDRTSDNLVKLRRRILEIIERNPN